MTEHWKPLPGFSSRYEVSDHGRIRSFARKEEKLLTPYRSSTCHRRVALTSDAGNVVTMNVGAAVLTAFVGPRPKRHHAGHLNGNPDDNRLQNLKWVLPRENCAHKRVHGTHLSGEGVCKAKLTQIQVDEIRASAAAGASNRELSRTFGVGVEVIGRIVGNKRWRGLLERRIALANLMAESAARTLAAPDDPVRRLELADRVTNYRNSARWSGK